MDTITIPPETGNRLLNGIVSMTWLSRVTVVHGTQHGAGAALYAAARASKPGSAILLVDSWKGDPLEILESALLTLAGREAVSRLDLPAAPAINPVLAASFRLHVMPEPDSCLLILARFEECLASLADPAAGFDRLLAEVANNEALDIHVVIMIDERSSALLDRYQGMLPGTGEGYLRMPPEFVAPDASGDIALNADADADAGAAQEWGTPLPPLPGTASGRMGPGMPARQALEDQAVKRHAVEDPAVQDEAPAAAPAAQGGDASERSFAALLSRVSATSPTTPADTEYVPLEPAPMQPEEEPAAPAAPVRKAPQQAQPPSRTTILLMALVAVVTIELGLLMVTLRSPQSGRPAAEHAQETRTPVAPAAEPAQPVPVEAARPAEPPALPRVDAGQPEIRPAAPDRAAEAPQALPGMEKRPDVATVVPEPEPEPEPGPGPFTLPRDAASKPASGIVRTSPGVYFHVGNEADRQRVSAAAAALQRRGIELVGIKIVSDGPSKPDIRYFRDNEREEALQVQKALLSMGFPVHRIKHIGRMEAKATPRLYEVWIMPGQGG